MTMKYFGGQIFWITIFGGSGFLKTKMKIFYKKCWLQHDIFEKNEGSFYDEVMDVDPKLYSPKLCEEDIHQLTGKNCTENS